MLSYVDDKRLGKQEVQSYIDELVARLLRLDEGKCFRIVMSEHGKITTSFELSLVLSCFHNENNCIRLVEEFGYVIKTTENLLTVLHSINENRRLAILKRYPDLIIDPDYLEMMLSLIPVKEQVQFLKHLFDLGDYHPQVLCELVARTKIEERFTLTKQYLDLITNQKTIIFILKLLSEQDKRNFLNLVKNKITDQDKVQEILDQFDVNERDEIAATFIYCRKAPVCVGMQPVEYEAGSAEEESFVVVDDHELNDELKRAILTELSTYLKLSFKANKKIVDEMRTTVEASKCLEDIYSCIKQKYDLIVPGNKQAAYPGGDGSMRLNIATKKQGILFNYRDLLEKCMAILQTNNIEATREQAPRL